MVSRGGRRDMRQESLRVFLAPGLWDDRVGAAVSDAAQPAALTTPGKKSPRALAASSTPIRRATIRRAATTACRRTGVDFFGKPLRAISRFSHQDAHPPPSSSRADRKHVRCTFPAASERHGRQVWNPPLPVQRVGADRIADCALQCQKTHLCSNVLSALKTFLTGIDFWKTPARHLPFQPSERPSSPFLTGIDFLENPGVPSLVSGIRKTKIPLLPVWEKGVGGDEGQKRGERRTPLITSRNSTPASRPPPDYGYGAQRALSIASRHTPLMDVPT
jgi:hypothetical protein